MTTLMLVFAVHCVGILETSAQIEAFGVPATTKVGRAQPPGADWVPGRIAIQCARNEAESFQVVFRGTPSLGDLRLEVDELRARSGKSIPVGLIEPRKVEWVDVNAPFDPRQPSPQPNFQPDPLPPVRLARDRFCLEPGRNLAFWITVSVPKEASAGEYRGELRLKAGLKTLAAVTVELHVFSFTLPQLPTLQSMVGLSAGNIYTAHGCRTAEEKEKIVRLYFEQYIRARLSPFLYAPGTMAFNPLPGGAIQYEFLKDAAGRLTGQLRLDFQGFDAAGRYYLDQRQAFSAFNFAPYLWARKGDAGRREAYLRFTDSRGNAVLGRNDDGTPNPLFDRLVVAFFRQTAHHLEEQGWLARNVYYVTDEPAEADTETIAAICRLVRQADPRIRTAVTYDPANRPRLAELVDHGRSLVSIWVPYCTLYREDVAAQQRRRGADYWLYDVKDFALISQSGSQNRGIFWDLWRRGAHGYLYYLSTWWGREATPWDRPNFLLPGVTYRYRHGDGYFFYPPTRSAAPPAAILDQVVTSVRWELMREGVEDYEYLHKLETLVASAEKRSPAAAAAGRRALAQARQLAEGLGGSTNYTIAALQLQKTPGWSWSTAESWLSQRAGSDSPLAIRFPTGLPDGPYDLWLRVYDARAHHGREYSRWKVNGKAYASSGEDQQGPVSIGAGQVEVRNGYCAFTLSPVGGDYGVIAYGVGLSRSAGRKTAGLYSVRHEIGAAIERLEDLPATKRGPAAQ